MTGTIIASNPRFIGFTTNSGEEIIIPTYRILELGQRGSDCQIFVSCGNLEPQTYHLTPIEYERIRRQLGVQAEP